MIKYIVIKIIKIIFNIKDHYFIYRKLNIFLPNSSSIKNYKFITIGEKFSIGENSRLLCQDPENGSRLEIGNNVAVNSGVSINADCGGEIKIGDNVLIGPDVVIRAANHKYDDCTKPIREQGHDVGKIIIENDVWLGAKVIVLPNVLIGEGCVVGAGSVVNIDLPAYSLAVGVPVKVIRIRNNQEYS